MNNAILEQMNPQQTEAVRKVSGPIMAVAGAGSGKTRVLTNRVAYLIEEIGIPPSSILAITFTNRAAEEMKSRVFKLIDIPLKGIWISTFHAMGAKILRYDIERLGYSQNFQIVDDEDSEIIIKTLLKDKGYDIKRYSPRGIASVVEQIKGRQGALEILQEPIKSVLEDVYPAYQKYLKKNNLVDFQDLLVLILELFNKFPDVLEKYQERFQYILVDEFQDTNDLQYEIVYNLAKSHRNLFIVGDEDQSIYSFRGSNIENIRKFMRDFPDYHKVILNQNYRSKTNILEAANSVIDNNRNRIPKQLFSELGEGEKVHHFKAENDEEEAYYIYTKIKALAKDGYLYKDMAVLYRNNAMSRKFEDVFLRFNIPYKVVGNISFYKRKEIKDVIAYLHLLVDMGDDYAFERIYNEPKRGIGETSFDKIKEYAGKENIKLTEAIDDDIPGVGSRGLARLRELKKNLSDIRKNMEETNLLETYEHMLEKTGYLGMLQDENLSTERKIEAERRLDNLKEFKTVILEKIKDFDRDVTNYEKLVEILTDLALREEAEEKLTNDDYVSLMTVHSAKGLEFRIVFVACLEQSLFPSGQSLHERPAIEEERRLFYVALTRARDLVFLTNARERFIYGHLASNPDSQFIGEIDKEYVEHSGLTKVREIKFPKPEPRHRKHVVQTVKSTDYDAVDNQLKVGDKIEHKTFGKGIIVALDDSRATIAFKQEIGIKILMKDHPSIKKVR
ncbi:MAG TPA: UvrD-helicase domain-containing protein [Candidatus Izemoplasmatales bacterium]|nr:UvrD-helicase domain-containing protein [Candidatus Izemoplasmatales bacterium]